MLTYWHDVAVGSSHSTDRSRIVIILHAANEILAVCLRPRLPRPDRHQVSIDRSISSRRRRTFFQAGSKNSQRIGEGQDKSRKDLSRAEPTLRTVVPEFDRQRRSLPSGQEVRSNPVDLHRRYYALGPVRPFLSACCRSRPRRAGRTPVAHCRS